MKKYRTLKEVIEAENLTPDIHEILSPLPLNSNGWAYIIFSKKHKTYITTTRNMKKAKLHVIRHYMNMVADNQIFMERIRGLQL